MVQNDVVVHWLNKPFQKAEFNKNIRGKSNLRFDSAYLRIAFSRV